MIEGCSFRLAPPLTTHILQRKGKELQKAPPPTHLPPLSSFVLNYRPHHQPLVTATHLSAPLVPIHQPSTSCSPHCTPSNTPKLQYLLPLPVQTFAIIASCRIPWLSIHPRTRHATIHFAFPRQSRLSSEDALTSTPRRSRNFALGTLVEPLIQPTVSRIRSFAVQRGDQHIVLTSRIGYRRLTICSTRSSPCSSSPFAIIAPARPGSPGALSRKHLHDRHRASDWRCPVDNSSCPTGLLQTTAGNVHPPLRDRHHLLSPDLHTWRLLQSLRLFHSRPESFAPSRPRPRPRQPPQSALVPSCPAVSRPLLPCPTVPPPTAPRGTRSEATRPHASLPGVTIAAPTSPASHGTPQPRANMDGGGATCGLRAPTSLPARSPEKA